MFSVAEMDDGDTLDRLAEAPAAAAAAAAAGSTTLDPVETYSFNTGLMVLLIVLWSSFGHKVAATSKYIGEGSVACGMGLLTGLIVIILQRYLSAESVHQLLTFNPADFFTYLLPPIIFYAGLSVKKKQFFRNLFSIASFGVLGTYVCFAVIAFVLYGFSQLPTILKPSDCLALGVIFAATDSVAVLQVLKQDRTPLLYSLVFGEGVMNDATAVALLRAVQALEPEGSLGMDTVVAILGRFLYLFAASLILGLCFGLGTAFLLKTLQCQSSPQEVAIIGMLAYLSYLCGELLGLSGIVALFCCAVAISHYALHNVTSMSRVTTVSAFQTLSYVSEGAIFIYVGMDTLDPLKWQNTYFGELTWMFCVLVLLMMVGRAVFVFPLTLFHNLLAAEERISMKDAVVIWWAGLMKGAITVALVYYHFDPKGWSSNAHRATLISTTLIVVLFSIMVLGAITKPLLDSMLGAQDGGSHTLGGAVPLSSKRHGQGGSGSGKYSPLYAVVRVPASDDVVANHMEDGTPYAGQPIQLDAYGSLPVMVEGGPDGQARATLLPDVTDNIQPAMIAAQGGSDDKPSSPPPSKLNGHLPTHHHRRAAEAHSPRQVIGEEASKAWDPPAGWPHKRASANGGLHAPPPPDGLEMGNISFGELDDRPAQWTSSLDSKQQLAPSGRSGFGPSQQQATSALDMSSSPGQLLTSASKPVMESPVQSGYQSPVMNGNGFHSFGAAPSPSGPSRTGLQSGALAPPSPFQAHAGGLPGAPARPQLTVQLQQDGAPDAASYRQRTASMQQDPAHANRPWRQQVMQAFQSNAAASEQASQGVSAQPSWTSRASNDRMPHGDMGFSHAEPQVTCHGLERSLSGGRNDRLSRWWWSLMPGIYNRYLAGRTINLGKRCS
ncbi:hypothetical protein WJX74_003416 [Apatococcus lobatus]|uniref:Cation/H+ exchanger transmembrane domain-containing protein n=1 Tax=Apatococcus lobatus TaxID=904363 RepID=A0AAW1QVH1_9CHLO